MEKLNNEPAITKSTVKILKFILRHQNCTFKALQGRFKGLDFMDLVLLCASGYLLCTRPGQLPTDFRDGKFFVSPEDTFWASPKTEQFLEERFQRKWQWIVPTTISALALVLSIVAFIVSLLPQVIRVQIVP